MDYISRYGFEFNPYTKSQKSFLIETSQYREVISRLNYLDQVKGFGLITGQPGMGKTTEPLPKFIAQAMADYSLGLATPEGYSGYGDEQGNTELRAKIAEVW